MAAAQISSRPNLIVLVQPFGDVASLVCTYSSSVPHSAARARVERLAQLTGARLDDVRIVDVVPQTAEPGSAARSPMKQTGVECTLYGARLVLDSALPLQPFLEAFGDTGAFEVLFLVQRQPGFRGLRRFESDGVTVLLTQDGSPYRYRFTVQPDKAAGVSLPLYAPPEPRPQTPRAEASRRSGGLWHLLVYGLGAGGAVFVTMLARGRIRAARASQT